MTDRFDRQVPEWPANPSGQLPPLHPRYGAATAPGSTAVLDDNAPYVSPPPPLQDFGPDFGASAPPLPPVPPAWPAPPPEASPGAKRPAGRGFVVLTAIVAAVLGAVLSLGVVWATGGFTRSAPATNQAGEVIRERVVGTNSSAAGSAINVVQVAKELRPSIVNVKIFNGSQQMGSGSGVIFRPDGYILTNNHVATGESSDNSPADLKVDLSDGRTLPATVVGHDQTTDIAVIKVDATNLPAAPLGSGSNLEVGEPVVAIGNPLGLDGGPSVSTGVISALGRAVPESDTVQLVNMIQTDAGISPGSSGGALADGGGAVIGITTAKAGAQENADNIGFAVPIDVARKVADQLMKTGKVTHPQLGITGSDAIDASGAVTGALIRSVVPGSGATNAGIQQGDVITQINGKPVGGMASLRVQIMTFNPGDKVKLRILRNGQTKDVDVALGQG